LKRSYHTITTKGATNARRLAEFFSRNGQGLLPMVDLIEQSRLAVDELIDEAGRATIETVIAVIGRAVGRAADAGAATPATAVARPASGSGVSARAQTGGE
jgi:hypothetical protein